MERRPAVSPISGGPVAMRLCRPEIGVVVFLPRLPGASVPRSIAGRAARAGRNPKTGEALQIAASKTVKFTAGKAFKDAVNQYGVERGVRLRGSQAVAMRSA